MLFRQCLVLVEIGLPFGAGVQELRIIWDPVGQVIFGEDGKLGAFLSGGGDELGGFGEVLFWLEGLVRGEGGSAWLLWLGKEGWRDLGIELDEGNLVGGRHGENQSLWVLSHSNAIEWEPTWSLLLYSCSPPVVSNVAG